MLFSDLQPQKNKLHLVLKDGTRVSGSIWTYAGGI